MILGIRGVAVVLLLVLIVEGPDLLLLAVLDARRWFPVGLVTGVVTLPLLPLAGVGFAPPWTLPAYVDDVSLPRTGLYHLVCCVFAAWLWTAPTLAIVGWVRETRVLAGTATGPIPPAFVAVAVGLFLSVLLLFSLALVAFVRVTPFQTPVERRMLTDRHVLRPAVVAVGVPLLAGFVVTLLGALVVLTDTVPTVSL